MDKWSVCSSLRHNNQDLKGSPDKDKQQPHPVSTSYASDENINSQRQRGGGGHKMLHLV